MRIAITADPLISVPPENYGGIERIIDFLVTGLVSRGHNVLLVANASSTVEVPRISYKGVNSKWTDHLSNIATIAQIKDFKPDVIHSFSRLAYLLPFLRSPVPKIMSYQREPTLSQVSKAVKLAKRHSLSFTGCSNYISDKIKPFANAQTVYNGVDFNKYEFNPGVDRDAPLIFLGRLEPIKGVKTAINVAVATKKKLIIAGNIPIEYAAYFETDIKPRLNDDIKYIGPVNDLEKSKLLGASLALLMPVDWNEPFGIVMVESMACGTPVIGFNKGSIPEVIKDDVNGYRCDKQDEMIELVAKIGNIDREAVRREAKKHFSSEVIVNEYLRFYNKCLQ